MSDYDICEHSMYVSLGNNKISNTIQELNDTYSLTSVALKQGFSLTMVYIQHSFT